MSWEILLFYMCEEHSRFGLATTEGRCYLSDRGWPARWALAALLLAVSLPGAVARAERPQIYALTDLRITTAPGQVIERGTLVMRDGLIEAVGVDVDVPADAEVIAGQQGWSVYPAFIDMAASVGLEDAPAAPSPPRGPRGEQKPRPGSPHELEAVHPEKSVIEELKLDHDNIERHRQLGFAIAQVLPEKGVFRGRSAVVAMRPGSPQRSVLDDESAQVVALETGSFMARQYPSVKMGAVAAVRQAFFDAARQGEWQQRYAANPVGMQRPEYRSSDAALLEVLQEDMRVLFVSLTALDSYRFAGLAAEFDLQAMIVARGLGDRSGDLVAAGMPVLLPLELPEKLELTDEVEVLDASLEQLQAAVSAPRLPRDLLDAGVEVAFVTSGMKSVRKFQENLVAAIDAGLEPDQALAALTTTPARLLGLPDVVGTIEPGKQANVMVVDGELFVKKPALRHVFIEGFHEEIEAKETLGDPDAVVDPRGTWEVITEVMGQTRESEWTIAGSRDAYTGFSESAAGGKSEFESLELTGNALTVLRDTPSGEMEITVIISADSLEGETTMESARGSVTISVEGIRIDGPQGDNR